jgi:hypothetical protein
LAVDALVTSMHLPEPALTSAPPDKLHCWAAEPLQSYSWTAVPLAVAAPATFTHLPPSPVLGTPAAALAGSRP